MSNISIDTKKIYLSPPHLSAETMAYLQDAIQSNWIAPLGPHVDGFETELRSYLKTGRVLSVNSGTASIHLGLLALGVCKGDEVICSTFTFCASASPIIYCNAKPVFVDSEPDTWNMDPKLLEDAILDRVEKTGKKPKVIIVVHLYGMPAKMDKIMEVSKKYEIPVLEDAAEALGSLFDGKAAGTFGEAGVLSFNGNKIITTSSGGALFSFNQKLIDRAHYLRQEAKEPLPHYEHREVGYNYKMSNLLAAVGRSQLLVLHDRVKARRKIFDSYVKQLSEIPYIRFQCEPENVQSNRWLSTVIIRHSKITRETIRLALAKANIESRPLWKPMHLQPVFAGCPAYTNGISERLFKDGLCLPSGSNLAKEDLERVVEVIKQVCNGG